MEVATLEENDSQAMSGSVENVEIAAKDLDEELGSANGELIEMSEDSVQVYHAILDFAARQRDGDLFQMVADRLDSKLDNLPPEFASRVKIFQVFDVVCPSQDALYDRIDEWLANLDEIVQMLGEDGSITTHGVDSAYFWIRAEYCIQAVIQEALYVDRVDKILSKLKKDSMIPDEQIRKEQTDLFDSWLGTCMERIREYVTLRRRRPKTKVSRKQTTQFEHAHNYSQFVESVSNFCLKCEERLGECYLLKVAMKSYCETGVDGIEKITENQRPNSKGHLKPSPDSDYDMMQLSHADIVVREITGESFEDVFPSDSELDMDHDEQSEDEAHVDAARSSNHSASAASSRNSRPASVSILNLRRSNRRKRSPSTKHTNLSAIGRVEEKDENENKEQDTDCNARAIEELKSLHANLDKGIIEEEKVENGKEENDAEARAIEELRVFRSKMRSASNGILEKAKKSAKAARDLYAEDSQAVEETWDDSLANDDETKPIDRSKLSFKHNDDSSTIEKDTSSESDHEKENGNRVDLKSPRHQIVQKHIERRRKAVIVDAKSNDDTSSATTSMPRSIKNMPIRKRKTELDEGRRKKRHRSSLRLNSVPSPGLKPGKKYKKWSRVEEIALMDGYRKFGPSWSSIHEQFNDKFDACRSTVDLKDKYRNLVKYGHVRDSTNTL